MFFGGVRGGRWDLAVSSIPPLSYWYFRPIILICIERVTSPINIIYNRNNVNYYNFFSQLTIQNLSGNILWAHVAVTYSINIVICYFIWYHWKKMVLLRQSWFRSKGYRNKIYSRTLMVTYVPMEFRTDEGLVHLMGKLKVDGIKIGGHTKSPPC